MDRVFWFLAGIVLGFVGAHYANRTDAGKRIFSNIDRGAKEFGDAVVKGYRAREAQFDHADSAESTVESVAK